MAQLKTVMKLLKKVLALCLPAGVIICMLVITQEDTKQEQAAGRISEARVGRLMDELTATPDRQQKAMDELVSAGDAAVPYLFQYLGDRRRLATHYVLFLNSAPTVSEKYFNTLAVSVDEATLRYLCWRIESCDPAFDEDDAKDRSVQIQSVFDWCQTAYARLPGKCDILKRYGAIGQK